ncbi:MAG: hypothetical protein ABF917_15995 [Gluconobacter oxydans]
MPHTGSRIFMGTDGLVGIVSVLTVRVENSGGIGKPQENATASFYDLIP